MKIYIDGIGRQIDGEFDLDWLSLTAREQHQIKVISGIRPTEYGEALATSDAAFISAVSLIALRRDGRPVSEDMLLDAPQGKIRFVFEELAADAVPPARGRRGSKSSAKPDSGDSSED